MSLRFAGYAAVFDRVDRAGDRFARGAFLGALGDVRAVPLLLQHRGRPVGAIEVIGEDAVGLRIEARVDDPALAAAVRSGALGGLSVGYRPVAVRRGATRLLERVTLVEVSLVAVPMQAAARIDQFFSSEEEL